MIFDDPEIEKRRRLLQIMQGALRPIEPSPAQINPSIQMRPEVLLGGDKIGKTNRILPISPSPVQVNPSLQMRPESMQAGVLPGDVPLATETEGAGRRGNLPAIPSMSSVEANQPAPNVLDYQAKPVRVHVGVSTKGLQGVDKSIADLQAQEQAAKDFPSSKVRDGEILPPKMYHGAGDRLKQAAKAAVISMGNIARSDPNASAAKILAGGATGGIIGAVNPVTADEMLNEAQLAKRRGEVGQQVALADDQATLEAKRAAPELKAREIEGEISYRQNQQELEARKQEIERQKIQGLITKEEADRKLKELQQHETERHNKEMERLGQARIDKPASQKEQPDYGQRKEWYLKKQGEAEATAKDLRQKADLIQPKEGYDLDASQKAQKEDYLRRAAQSDKDALEYRDKADEAATMPSIRQSSSGGRTWSRSKWATANPNGDVEAATKAAQSKGYRVVD